MKLLSAEYGFSILKYHQLSKRDLIHDTVSYLIRSDKGKMILREHFSNASRDSISYEHSLLEYLFKKNLKVAKPLANRHGETFLEINGKFYVFFEFIPGYLYYNYFFNRTDKIRYIRQGAETLGLFHSVVRDFIPKGQKLWCDFRKTSTKFQEYHDIVRKKTSKDGFDHFFLDMFGYLNEKLMELGEFIESFDQLPKCIIHEDFGGYNLIFRNGKLSGILDFMDAHLDWRAKDVIFSVFVFTCTRKSLYEAELARTFLNSYQAFCDIQAEDIDMMPDLFCLKRLNELPSYLAAHYSGNQQNPKYRLIFTKFVEEINWHQQKKRQLSEQLKKHINK